MKKKKPLSKFKVNLNNDKKREDIHYKIFIGLCIVNVVYYCCFEPAILGSDSRYAIYVFWLPMIIGLLISSRYYIFKEIWDDFFKHIENESSFKRIYISIFILLSNFLFAYLIFGFSAHVIWNYVNKNEAKNSQLEIFILPVDEFSKEQVKEVQIE